MLYLIAHKVRGEPAFDVAQRCDDMGTPDDPGPWWIIPTSGHRAYPYWTCPFGDLGQFEGNDEYSCIQFHLKSVPMPADLPDHYANSSRQEPAKNPINPRRLLEAIGLAKPFVINRRLP